MGSKENEKLIRDKFGEKGAKFYAALVKGGDITMEDLAKKLGATKSEMRKMYNFMIENNISP